MASWSVRRNMRCEAKRHLHSTVRRKRTYHPWGPPVSCERSNALSCVTADDFYGVISAVRWWSRQGQRFVHCPSQVAVPSLPRAFHVLCRCQIHSIVGESSSNGGSGRWDECAVVGFATFQGLRFDPAVEVPLRISIRKLPRISSHPLPLLPLFPGDHGAAASCSFADGEQVRQVVGPVVVRSHRATFTSVRSVFARPTLPSSACRPRAKWALAVSTHVRTCDAPSHVQGRFV